MNQQQPTSIQQVPTEIAPIELMAIAEQGESPTAIILAIAILISALFGSITSLVRIIVAAAKTR